MAWSILSALVGVGSYLLARRARGSETQQNRSNLEDKIRERSRQLERSYNITLEALSDMLYLKNPGSKGHSKRVTAFTIAIARALGLSTEAIKIIARGALMHDIGMLGVPDAILNKSGHVTEREMEIVRKHCY
jgi:HD-GYP domain-containing protein (c-di-GMP phosphodiesterase class II)